MRGRLERIERASTLASSVRDDHDTRMGVLSRVLVVGSAAVALVALIMRARVYWPFTVDDTFITLRYSKHLAEGLGPSWNPRGAPVEGYTTALWMLVLALPHALGLDALVFAKAAGAVLSFLAVVVSAVLAFELTRGLDPRTRRLAALAPFAITVAYWPLALHAISGMETGLAALLLTLFNFVSLRYARNPTPVRGRSLGVLALLATLTRPEAGACCAVTLLAELWLTPRAQRRALLRGLALFLVLPAVLYFAVRYAHFGLFFPLSFYVKAQGQPRFAGFEEVRGFFAPFAWQRPALGLLALYGAFGVRALVPALLGILTFAVSFIFPAHVMGFESRYLFPLYPSVAALIAAGTGKVGAQMFSGLERALAKSSPSVRARLRAGTELALIAAAWALLGTALLPDHEPPSRARWVAYGEGLQRAHIALAEQLKKARMAVLRPTIALLDVGAVAYYSEWFTIDTFGLNDAHVALTRRRDVPYVFSYEPELVVVVSEQASRYVEVFDWETPIHASALERGYTQRCSYRFLDDYHLLVLVKPGSVMNNLLSCPKP